MSQTLTPPVSPPPAPEVNPTGDFPRKRWTVKECRFLQEAGLLTPGKYELIEGDIVLKMPQGFEHLLVINRLLAALLKIFVIERFIIQGPVGIGRSDMSETTPEPDIAILQNALDSYATSGIRPASDVLLVVEVSVSTLTGDTTTKTRIYARAGVPEYWVVDVEGRRLIVHRQPSADNYGSVVVLDETATVSPLTAPASVIAVRNLLP